MTQTNFKPSFAKFITRQRNNDEVLSVKLVKVSKIEDDRYYGSVITVPMTGSLSLTCSAYCCEFENGNLVCSMEPTTDVEYFSVRDLVLKGTR